VVRGDETSRKIAHIAGEAAAKQGGEGEGRRSRRFEWHEVVESTSEVADTGGRRTLSKSSRDHTRDADADRAGRREAGLG
jgi:hypothetical protein